MFLKVNSNTVFSEVNWFAVFAGPKPNAVFVGEIGAKSKKHRAVLCVLPGQNHHPEDPLLDDPLWHLAQFK